MANTTEMGMNRTGIKSAPSRSKQIIDAAQRSTPTSPDGQTVESQRLQLFRDAERVGTMPPPASVKEAAKVAAEALKGQRAVVLLDKMGERLAFERTGVRLYQALMVKHEAHGSWKGGPKRDELQRFLDQEIAHFDLLRQWIERLGADPTVITPAADLAAVASSGVLQVVSDARTDLRDSLDAILIAELVDQASWEMLCRLAMAMGRDDLAGECQSALTEESEHLRSVRRWTEASLSQLAQIDLGRAEA